MCGVRGLFSSGLNCSGEVIRLLTKKLEMAYNFQSLGLGEERVAEELPGYIFTRLRHRFKCSGIGKNPELVEAENAGV